MAGVNARRAQPLLLPAGAVALFLGEWVWRGSAFSSWLSVLGLLCFGAALLLTLVEAQATDGTGPWPVAPPLLALLAGGLLLVTDWVPAGVHGGVDWKGLLHGGWLLAGGFAVVLYGFVMAARPDMAARRPDTRARLQRAGQGAVLLALALALGVTLNFIFAQLPWRWNLAYFKVTEPSEATRAEVARLPEPLDVGVFFAQDDGPGKLVRDYFEALLPPGTEHPTFSVTYHDAELDPAAAKNFRVRSNGIVVVRKGDLRAPVQVGAQMNQARTALRQFDGRFLAALLKVGRQQRVVYMTVGHGERNERGDNAPRKDQGFRRFTRLLEGRNLEVKRLSYADGLGSRIPEDANLVVIAGAVEPFLPAEIETLRAYLDDGGRLMVFLEPAPPRRAGPDAGNPPLQALLAEYGIEFSPVMLANDLVFGRRSYTAADHILLVSNRYENQPAVETLRRNAQQYPLFLLGAGGLKRGNPPRGLRTNVLVNAMPGTWSDQNGNFVFDGTMEKKEDAALVMATEPRNRRGGNTAEARQPTLLALADADMASDLLMGNRANLTVMGELVNWVMGEEDSIGLPESEEDLQIQHAKGDDWLWFYLPVIGVPAVVLLIGLWAMGRVRRQGRGEAA